jgi:biotin carboxylase
MTAWGVVQSLRERHAGVRVVVADTNPRELVAAAADADAFVRVPPARDARFAKAFHEAVERHGVDTYVPIHDVEIIEAAAARDTGVLPAGLVTTAPPADAAQICWDKLRVAEALGAAGLPTPVTLRGDAAGWTGPCMVKPREGVGSRGARLLAGPELRSGEEASSGYVLQEACVAPEITIDAFRSSRDGWFAATCRERVEVRQGIATRCRVYACERLEGLAQRVGETLGLTGTFCLQVMRSADDDRWLVTDVNPRPGGATRMSVAAGMDYHGAMLADAWGLDPRPHLPGLDAERWVARGFVERIVAPEPA